MTDAALDHGPPIEPAPDYDDAPHNVEFEQELLGRILINGERIGEVYPRLRPEHFHFDVHRRMFEKCVADHLAGRVPNPVTMKEFFEGDAGLIEVGGTEYIRHLMLAAVEHRPNTLGPLADAIIDLAGRRLSLEVATDLTRSAGSPDAVRDAVKRLEGLGQGSPADEDFKSHYDVSMEALQHTEDALKGKIEPGVMTGLYKLDHMMGGMSAGDLIVVAGRPGIGKSLIAQGIGTNCAARGEGVAFVSLEMTSKQIGHRALAAASNVPYASLRSGRVSDDELCRVVDSMGTIDSLPFHSVSAHRLRVAGIHDLVTGLMERKRIRFLIVDYLQLIEAERAYAGNKVAEVEQISGALKRLAISLDIPVMVLSQLSRDLEKRDNKRPTMADLRWSGAIEQDADMIILIYRRHYYERVPPHDPEAYADWTLDKNVSELIVAKNRQGRTDTARIFADMATGRMGNLEEHLRRRGGAGPWLTARRSARSIFRPTNTSLAWLA